MCSCRKVTDDMMKVLAMLRGYAKYQNLGISKLDN